MYQREPKLPKQSIKINMEPKIGKNSSIKWLVYIVAVIVATNAAVFLDIPVLRQLLAVVFLAIIPGLLILFILKLHRLPLAEKLILVVGLSIAFLMIFGWILNQICIVVGHMTPLSTNFLAIAQSIALAVLLTIAYVMNREAFTVFTFHLELNMQSKLCLLLPAIFPLMSILGSRFINTSGNNIILMTLLYLIPVAIILIVLQRHRIAENTYPITIVITTAALLSMFWLRSEHILGHDVHLEYNFFQTTLLNQHWSVLGYSVLNSCLSISILPTIFQSLLGTGAQEQLFKGLYVLISSFTPLVVYVISRKYLGGAYAFLAAIFYAFGGIFLVSPGNPRTSVAIFFFALSIMVLFHNSIRSRKKMGLFILFVVATIFSHYSTTYIFFFILLFVFLVELILKKYGHHRTIMGPTVILFFFLIFLWYSQITAAPFVSGVDLINRVIYTLADFFVAETRSQEVISVFGSGTIREYSFLSWGHFAITWASFALIALGVIGTLKKSKEMLSTPQWGNTTPSLLKAKFEIDYFLTVIACCGVLVAIVVLPLVSISYGIQRTFSQAVVLLSTFFVLGGMMLAKRWRINPYILILIVLIPYSLFNTGALYESFGIHNKNWLLTTEAENPALRYEFVHNQETHSVQWLKRHMGGDHRIYIVDSRGTCVKLQSQGGIPLRLIHHDKSINLIDIPESSFIYLSYVNVVYDEFVDGNTFHSMNEHAATLVNKNKLYVNGGSEVYR